MKSRRTYGSSSPSVSELLHWYPWGRSDTLASKGYEHLQFPCAVLGFTLFKDPFVLPTRSCGRELPVTAFPVSAYLEAHVEDV